MNDELNETGRVLILVERLLAQTRSSHIAWERYDSRYAYVFSTADASVVLDTKDDDGQAPFRVRVFNDDGIVISTAISPEQADDSHPFGELWQLARRSALKVDETLDSLLRQLGGGS